MTLEVFLLLLEDFVFPGPEGLQTEGFTLGVSLVLFEYLDRVTYELDVAHAGAVVFSEAEVLNSSETSW